MKVLIIGGTGVISTSITRLLLERGDDVTHYNRGVSPDLNSNSQVKRITGDRTDYATFEKQMLEAGYFDCVMDMICFEPEEAESDVRAFKGRTGQFIFCSTCDVYAKPAKSYPIREDHERKASPSFPYAYKKVICEDIFFKAHERGHFPVTIIRPAATYSEIRSPIVHTFRGGSYHFDRLRRGKPIILHGDGTSMWVECHSDDVARAFVGAIGNTKAYGKGYHAAGDEWMNWDHIWQTAARVVGGPEPRFVHIPTDLLAMVAPGLAEWCVENFKYDYIYDNTQAKADLGFKYTISWEEGLKRCVKWLEEHGGFEDSDNYPFYDRIIEAWERLGGRMAEELKDIG